MAEVDNGGNAFRLPGAGTATGGSWCVLESGPSEPERNMAFDEALLESAADRGKPVLRTYAWNRPAATFGYFQRHSEIAAWTSLRPLIRRPTGGGLVPHEADWTYSVAVPPGHPWYDLHAVDSYRTVHAWLRAAFGAMGLRTELAPCCDPQGPGQCFVGAEQHDLMFDGRKLAGAAQRRNRLGLLIQGSVQPPSAGWVRTEWEAALRSAAAVPGIRWESLHPEGALLSRVEQLAGEKYGSDAYNRKR